MDNRHCIADYYNKTFLTKARGFRRLPCHYPFDKQRALQEHSDSGHDTA